MKIMASSSDFDLEVSASVKIYYQLLVLILLSIISVKGYSQDNVGDDSTILYPFSYFTQFAPRTALDMLNRIPGMTMSGSSRRGSSNSGRNSGGSFTNVSRGGRGLGAGNNGVQILINGKRTAGKNNDTQAQLRRIDADQVDYIEIIRGTSGELDVRGSTQIANIVLFNEVSNTTINYQASTDYYADHTSKPGGSISYAGQAGDLNMIVSASAVPGYRYTEMREKSILPGELPNDFIGQTQIIDNATYTLSTNLDYQFSAKSSARFNALLAEDDNPTEVDRLTVDLKGKGFKHSLEREDNPATNTNWEVGGDYEFRRNNGDRFKVLGIANKNDTTNTRQRWDVFEDLTEQKNLFLDTASTLEERIVRGSYTTDLFSGQSVEFGAERSQTVLDSKLALEVLSL